jgi:hypothetical protein
LNKAATLAHDSVKRTVTAANTEIDHLKACIRAYNTKHQEYDTDSIVDQIGFSSATLPPVDHQKSSNNWASAGSAEDDQLFSDFVHDLEKLHDFLGIDTFKRHDVVKFSGLLASPGLIMLHYPPSDAKGDTEPYKNTMNPGNICIHNLLAKMGLTENSAEALSMAWIEKFFIKTSLHWRERNKRQPYAAAHPAEVVELNAQFQKKLLSLSDDTVRLVCGEINVKEAIAAAILDEHTILFSLSETQLYGQP